MTGLKQSVLLVAAAVAGGLIVWVGLESRERRSESKERPEISEQEPGAAKTPGVVRLDPESQKRAGIRTEPPTAHTLRPQLVAYGRLEEDPSRSLTVRAPLAGTLLASEESAWPAIGQTILDAGTVGVIEPRLAAADQISLTNQLNQARSELRASESAATAARAAFERARILNADRKNVSDRVLQEAESRWNAEEARLKAAQESIRLLEASLRSTGPGGRSPLTARRGGEVVEVMAQPGEAIESGQPIVRLARFDQLLARVALPVGQNAPPDAARAQIVAAGFEDHPFQGEHVALSSTVDPRIQSTSLVFRIVQDRTSLRPGLAVVARISLAGASGRGYLVPRTAVVHFRGKKYVYVEKEAGVFERRDIEPLEPVDGGYFTTSLRGDERLVVTGPQALLSEENKSGLEVEGE
jgi:hypothetical protein